MASIKDFREQPDNITVYRKKRHFNIGLAIFSIIFIYLFCTVVLYLTKDRVSSYEVREGTIVNDLAYTALAVRKESVISSEQSGYVNYYQPELSRVCFGTTVASVSEQKLALENAQEETAASMTSEQQKTLIYKLQSFNEGFSEENYGDTYALKTELTDILQNVSSQYRTEQLNAVLGENGGGISVCQSQEDGIVLYMVDGYENITLDTLTDSDLEKKDYRKTSFENDRQVSAGDPMYKLITDENWTIVFEMKKEDAEKLQATSMVKVRFKKDNQTQWGTIAVVQKGESYWGEVTFSTSMIRYAKERYLDIELILEDETGLKIPKSAKTEKEFTVVPVDYITQGGDSTGTGVLRQTTDKSGNAVTEFVSVTVYEKTEEEVYLDPSVIRKGDVLLKPDSNETYAVSESKTLDGVYNINKGYAVFKQIKILCESDEYYIVESGNKYGLSNYDHIALDGSSVKENDVIAQ